MIVQLYDSNRFIISCTDRELLDRMKERMDGYKIRGRDQIIIPLRSAQNYLDSRKLELNGGIRPKRWWRF